MCVIGCIAMDRVGVPGTLFLSNGGWGGNSNGAIGHVSIKMRRY